MRRTLSTMLIAGALIIVGLNACTKKDYNPIPQTITQPAQQTKLNLVATEWTSYDGQVYVSAFQHILADLPINNGSHVKVYADDGGQLILISNSPVMYEGHALWATNSHYDLTLTYRCPEAPMPFQTLHVEVVVK